MDYEILLYILLGLIWLYLAYPKPIKPHKYKHSSKTTELPEVPDDE